MLITTKNNNNLVTSGEWHVESYSYQQPLLESSISIGYDHPSTGNNWAVKLGRLVEADNLKTDNYIDTLETSKRETIILFATKTYAEESMAIVLIGYQNNGAGALSLLDAAAQCGVKNFIFSSSCEVYRQPETHFIPNTIFAALNRQTFTLFGCDYPTPDGTCIRDCIHVSDFAAAHLLAQKHLSQGGDRIAANLGHGSGLSAKKVLNTIERTTNRCITTHLAPAREGDLSRIDANYRFAKKTLRWNPSRSSLDRIIKDVVAWHKIKYSQPHSKLDTTCH